MDRVFLIFLVWFDLCASDYRTLDEGEGSAFLAVWGVDNVEALMRIQKDLPKYWKEREDFLLNSPERALTHRAFCRRYVYEAKEYAQKTLASSGRQLWLQDPESVDALIKEYFEEGSGVFSHVQLLCWASACDYIDRPEFLNDHMATAQGLRDTMEQEASACCEARPVIERLANTLRWTITPNGKFSMFDYLVMRSKKYHLCSVLSNPEERSDACWHDQFFGWLGAYHHDVSTHAQCAQLFEDASDNHNVSYQNYFDACCNAETLSGGDIVTMSQKVVGCFCQFHEFPSDCEGAEAFPLFWLIFPKMRDVAADLHDVAPYFMNVPLDFDWCKKPLHKKRCSSFNIDRSILGWVALSCYYGLRFLDPSDREAYLDHLECELRCMSNSDMQRYPRFADDVLEILYKMEPNASEISWDRYVSGAKYQAAECAKWIQSVVKKSKGGFYFTISAPYPVRLMLVSVYKVALKGSIGNYLIVNFCDHNKDGSVRVFQDKCAFVRERGECVLEILPLLSGE